MSIGIILALVSYASFAFSDAFTKSFGQSLSVFEIAFFITIFSLIPSIISKPKGEQWRTALRYKHPWLMQLRGLCGLTTALLVTVAFTTIPLADVYALVFLTPVFVVILSVFILKEEMSTLRWFLLAISFLGVMLVVRPGFRDLQLRHLCAAAAAISSSIGAIVLKKISAHEKRVSLLSGLLIYTTIVCGIMMIATFVVPTPTQLLFLFLAGSCAGLGHICMIAATRRAPANRIAPAQYTQIFWAIILGAIFFGEVPDTIAIAGLVVVVGAGFLNANAEAAHAQLMARLSRFRSRKPTPYEVNLPLEEEPLPEAIELEINQSPTRPII